MTLRNKMSLGKLRVIYFLIASLCSTEFAFSTDPYATFGDHWEMSCRTVTSRDGFLTAVGVTDIAGREGGAIFLSSTSVELGIDRISIEQEEPKHLAVSDDNAFIAAITWDHSGRDVKEWNVFFQLWSVKENKLLFNKKLDPNGPWGRLHFSPDGKRVFMADGSEITVFDVEKQSFGVSFKCASFNEAEFDVSPDGKLLALTSARDASVMILDSNKFATVKTLAGPSLRKGSKYYQCKFSPDNKLVAAVNGQKQIQIWDLENPSKKPTSVEQSGFHAITFSNDGKQIAVNQGKSIGVFEAQSGKLLKTVDLSEKLKGYQPRFAGEKNDLCVEKPFSHAGLIKLSDGTEK